MTLYSNQFGITKNKGSLTQRQNNVFSGVVAAAETGTLLPGQPLKIADVSSPIPHFLAAGVNDEIFGFISFNLKDQSFVAGDSVEVATKDSVMIMEASAAIAAGAKVECVASGVKVKTWAGSNTIAGIAMGKAASDGDLIPVWVQTPSFNEAMSLEALLAINPTGSGTAGQSLVVDGDGTGLEFVDLVMADVSDLDELSILDLADTPSAIGTENQALLVDAAGTAVEFVDLTMSDISDLGDLSVLDLTDTPAAFGSATEVLVVNTGEDALEFAAN